MAAIIRSAHLPVKSELVLSNLIPPAAGYQPPAGRMDRVVTDSDLNTMLADVTITHPNPSHNQQISSSMLQPGHFATSRETSKRNKYGQVAVVFGAKCIPLVLETYGTMGSALSTFIRKLLGSVQTGA